MSEVIEDIIFLSDPPVLEDWIAFIFCYMGVYELIPHFRPVPVLRMTSKSWIMTLKGCMSSCTTRETR